MRSLSRNLVYLFLALALAGGAFPAAGISSDNAILVNIQQKIQSGNLRGARIDVQNTLKVLPGDPRLYNFLGVIDAQEGKPSDADANFRRAIGIAPRFIGAYLNLGRLYQQSSTEHSNEKALEIYSQLLTFDPDNIEANYQAAWLLNRMEKFDSSLQHLARLPAPAQHRPPSLALQCANEAALRRLDQAARTAQELLAQHPTEPDVLPIVPLLVQHQEIGLATTLLEAVINDTSASPAALHQLALLYEDDKRFKDARAMLTKELEKSGQPSVPLLSQLAKMAYQAGDFEGALGYLAHARDLEPGNATTQFLFGLVCIDLKLPPEARESLKKAVSLDPGNPYYNYALAVVLLQQHNPDDAIRYFTRFRELRPDDPRGNFALGVAYFDAGQANAARKQLAGVTDRAETRVGAQLYLGRVALQEGNLVEAGDHFRRAAEANPSGAEPYIDLGQLHIRAKEYDLAAEALNRALQLAPDNYSANFNLLLLYRRTKDPRAELQSQRLAKMQQTSEERERMLLRSLDIRPY
jgi:tetratricopeptide (TPR) repeat protein